MLLLSFIIIVYLGLMCNCLVTLKQYFDKAHYIKPLLSLTTYILVTKHILCRNLALVVNNKFIVRYLFSQLTQNERYNII